MQIYGKSRIPISLMLLAIVTFAFVIILPNNGFSQSLHNNTIYGMVNQTLDSVTNAKIDVGEGPTAIAVDEDGNTVYVANSYSNTVSVISGKNNTKIKDIPVGERPTAITFDELTDTVYVANSRSNTVSVISAENNTKIGEDIPVGITPAAIEFYYDKGKVYVYIAHYGSDFVSVISAENNTKIKEITIGGHPTAIAINYDKDEIYVANSAADSVSVISAENNTKIGDITVGNSPRAIASNYPTDTLYVANSFSDTVSVINTTNNKKIKDIPVGDRPIDIQFDSNTDTLYVANSRSNTVSVIDGISNKVVAGITFETNPFNSGYIECDGLISPISQYFYVWSGAECIAKPNKGFEFVSWEENLKDDSSHLITVSQPASTLESIKDFFNIKSNEPEANLNVTKFGTFTANFKELPPPLPSEYWIPLYGLIPGFFIPSIIKWLNGKRQRRNLREYLDKIGKVDRHTIEKEVLKLYSNGKISDSHYQMLKDKISEYYEKGIDK